MTRSNRGRDPRRDYHHFIPKLLLRHFARLDGRVVVHDRNRGWKSFLQKPDRIGGEKHLYSPNVSEEPGSDPRDDSIERWFESEIDAPAGKPLAKLVQGARVSDLTPEEFLAVAGFVGMLDIRGPASADFLVPLFAQAAREGIMDTDQAFTTLRSRGVEVTREDVLRVQREKVEELVQSQAKPGWLSFLVDQKARALSHLAGKLWFIVDAPLGLSFLTSDNGIVKFSGGFHHPCSHHFGDFEGRTHWLVPISPQRAIALAPLGSNVPPPSTAEFISMVNAQLVTDANRFVYSRELVNL